MKRKNRVDTIFFIFITSLMAGGCATTSMPVVTTTPLPAPYHSGVYHQVLKGQTLWRIAKAYDVDIKNIIDINKISDPSKITVDQKIFIPGARRNLEGEFKIPVTQQSDKGYIWPVKGKVVSYFGSIRDGVTSKGIDIEVDEGSVVVAARSGKVVFCDEKVKGLGKTIIIEHNDGYSSVYAHNSINLVECGDYVKQGDKIAKVGTTGRVERPTLHFQIRKGHTSKDPFYYLS